MPTLVIKDLPPDLLQKLKTRADRHRRSVDSKPLTNPEQTLNSSEFSAEDAIAQAEALNDRIGKTFDSTILEEKKREGLA